MVRKKEVHFRPESFLSIGEYAGYDRLPLWRRAVRQYVEREMLPYLDFRLHLNSSHPQLAIIDADNTRAAQRGRYRHSRSVKTVSRPPGVAPSIVPAAAGRGKSKQRRSLFLRRAASIVPRQ